MNKAIWIIQYTYFDHKTSKELSGDIDVIYDENEEPYGTFVLKCIEQKWAKANYNGDLNSIRIQTANRI